MKLRSLRNMTLLLGLIVLTVSVVSASEKSVCNTLTCELILPEYGLPSYEIEAYTAPNFAQNVVETDLLNDRWYMQVDGTVQVYDAPNGNIIRTLDGGFNFITAMVQQDGWTQINVGEWVRSEKLSSTNQIISQFTGMFLPEEFPQYTPAWMLVNAYPSKEPGGPAQESNGLLWRYTPITIFDSAIVDGYRWYQVGVDKWLHQHHVAKIQPLERPETVETDRWIGIDLYEQVLIVYENEKAIFATLISTGLPRWPTYEGTFNIYYRHPRKDMSWGTPGDDFYYLEEVPWTMFFDEGRALHGAYWHDGLGYRRSHGCVNMSITDAYWLYHWVADGLGSVRSADVETGPNVYVYSSDTYEDA